MYGEKLYFLNLSKYGGNCYSSTKWFCCFHLNVNWLLTHLKNVYYYDCMFSVGIVLKSIHKKWKLGKYFKCLTVKYAECII